MRSIFPIRALRAATGVVALSSTTAAAAPSSVVSYPIHVPVKAESWSTPSCDKAGDADNFPAVACQSSSAYEARIPDAPISGLVRFTIVAVHISPGLDVSATKRQHAAATYRNGILLYVSPKVPLASGTRLELRPIRGSDSFIRRGTQPFEMLTAPESTYFMLSTDRSLFRLMDFGTTYEIVAIALDGATLGRWPLPTQGTINAVHSLVAAIDKVAARDIADALASLPASLTTPPLKALTPVSLATQQATAIGYEATVISRCLLMADGRATRCVNLDVLGETLFGEATLQSLATTRFSLPSNIGKLPRLHVFRTNFALPEP